MLKLLFILLISVCKRYSVRLYLQLSCPFYVICVCLHIVMPNTYCVCFCVLYRQFLLIVLFGFPDSQSAIPLLTTKHITLVIHHKTLPYRDKDRRLWISISWLRIAAHLWYLVFILSDSLLYSWIFHRLSNFCFFHFKILKNKEKVIWYFLINMSSSLIYSQTCLCSQFY
jgi:hypothetical protein